jgi:hypothetical protein
MGPKWQFIASREADGKVTHNARQTVRKNAMRVFRRDERLQRLKQFQEGSDGDPHDKEARFGSNTDAGQALLPPYASSSPSEWVDEGLRQFFSLEIGSGLAFDPFSSTPLYSHHEAPMLFAHCKNKSRCFLRISSLVRTWGHGRK